MKRIYILTGPSGAGTSTAKYAFEDRGFYILENFPAVLTNEFVEKIVNKHDEINDYCLIPRITDAKAIWLELKKYEQFTVIPILLYADKEELLRRYTLSRRSHPTASMAKVGLETAIDNDLRIADFLREEAEVFIDTSKTSIKQLRTILFNEIDYSDKPEVTTISFVSFGLKNGLPKDIDMLIDCRILPNPYWVESLKEKNGLDKEIVDYLNSFTETKDFIKETIKYLDYHLEKMQEAARGNYVVGVCCSGGHHRSTYVADFLAKHYAKKYKTLVFHRDCPDLNK